jgi:hypothetical protein
MLMESTLFLWNVLEARGTKKMYGPSGNPSYIVPQAFLKVLALAHFFSKNPHI